MMYVQLPDPAWNSKVVQNLSVTNAYEWSGSQRLILVIFVCIFRTSYVECVDAWSAIRSDFFFDFVKNVLNFLYPLE